MGRIVITSRPANRPPRQGGGPRRPCGAAGGGYGRAKGGSEGPPRRQSHVRPSGILATKNRTPVFGCTASPLLYTLRSRVVNRLCDRPLRRWSIHIRPLPAPPALAPATTLILPSQRS